jgi:hypothetical protein
MQTRSLSRGMLPVAGLLLVVGGCGGAGGEGFRGLPDGSLAADVVTTPYDGTAPQSDGSASDAPASDASAPDAGAPADATPPADASAEGAADAPNGDAPGMDAPGDRDSSSDGSTGDCPALPAGGLYATIADDIRHSVSHLWVDNQLGIDQLLAYWHGTSTGGLPVGPLVCMPADWNCPWHFYIDPQTIQFADVSVEVCQGWDLEVESNCPAFRAGSGGCYAPLGETITEVRDCRTDPTCPVVAK